MKILFDTSIIVEIDRHNSSVIKALKEWTEEGHELLVSTITVSEILTGSYLRKDINVSVLTAKEILNQFIWHEINGETAEKAAKLFSYLIIEKKLESIEYPDVLIGASFLSSGSDALITLNKKDFMILPGLKDKVFTIEEFMARDKHKKDK